MIIAIDGGAASGKSTVCACLASSLGYPYFNAGLIYRGIALWAIRTGLSFETPLSAAEVSRACEAIDVSFSGQMTRVLLQDEDVTSLLKSHDVTGRVPDVSNQLIVRVALTDFQRAVAARCLSGCGGVIVDGRDATTVVWPNAEVRVLLIPEDASGRADEDTAARNALDSRHSEFGAPGDGVTAMITRQGNLDEIAVRILRLVEETRSKAIG